MFYNNINEENMIKGSNLEPTFLQLHFFYWTSKLCKKLAFDTRWILVNMFAKVLLRGNGTLTV